MATETYHVQGMTCEHCVQAVTREVGAVAGVADVAVLLDGGVLTVSGEGVAADAVREAVEEAGYSLA